MPETQPTDTTSEPTPAPAPTSSAAAPGDPVLPRRLLFRIPGAALVGVAFLVLCESAVAFAGLWFTLLYLIPLGLAYWIVRTRTTIDADAIEVRRAFTRRRLPWSAIASLRVRDRKWVRAVAADGTETVLPCVHTRHLSALAIISGGRLADPLADLAQPAEPEEPVADDTAEAAAEASAGSASAVEAEADRPGNAPE